MNIQELIFLSPQEPAYVKVMEKEAWIYWRLCLKLRRQKTSLAEMNEEFEVWLEGASGFLQRKIALLEEEIRAREKIGAAKSNKRRHAE